MTRRGTPYKNTKHSNKSPKANRLCHSCFILATTIYIACSHQDYILGHVLVQINRLVKLYMLYTPVLLSKTHTQDILLFHLCLRELNTVLPKKAWKWPTAVRSRGHFNTSLEPFLKEHTKCIIHFQVLRGTSFL